MCISASGSQKGTLASCSVPLIMIKITLGKISKLREWHLLLNSYEGKWDIIKINLEVKSVWIIVLLYSVLYSRGMHILSFQNLLGNKKNILFHVKYKQAMQLLLVTVG